MALLGQIEILIEEEVQRRVDETLTPLLEYISKTYDISMKQLMMDAGKASTGKTTTCMGLSKKNKVRCKNRARANGFCHMHQDQYKAPKPKEKELKHTHTLPPFYMAGCPVCDRKQHGLRDLVDCFDNE
jgi:hypothetical protein